LCPEEKPTTPEQPCVSAEIPNHQDILDRLHSHDIRLTRVEVQQNAMAHEITEQTERLEKMDGVLGKMGDKVEALMVKFAGMDSRLQLVLKILSLGIPAILALEIWAGLR